MIDPGYSLGDRAARQVAEAVRLSEALPRFGGRAYRAGPGRHAGHTAVVRVDGPIDGNYYPGFWVDARGDEASKTDRGDCWVWPLNGDSLAVGTYYVGRLVGLFDGLPVFAPAAGGQYSGHYADVARSSTFQSIPSATWTAISFDGTTDDANDFWDSGAPTRLTCPAGAEQRCFLFVAHVRSSVITADKVAGVRIAVSGSPQEEHYSGPYRSGNPAIEFLVPFMRLLSPGQYVEFQVYQNTVGSVDFRFGVKLSGFPFYYDV